MACYGRKGEEKRKRKYTDKLPNISVTLIGPCSQFSYVVSFLFVDPFTYYGFQTRLAIFVQ